MRCSRLRPARRLRDQPQEARRWAVAASDPEALIAVGLAFDELRLVVEPGGAVGLAALLAGRLDVLGKTVAIVLSGGNVGDEMLTEGVRAYRAGTR